MRTPCPSRSAPHHCSASQIEGSPNASPAWMVKCAFCWRRYSNASRCRVGGKPASAPAMSKPTHAEIAVPDGQLGDLPGARGVPHRGEQAADPDPATGLGGPPGAQPEALQHRLHHRFQRQALLDVQLGGEPDLGVDDAVGGQVLGALGGHPDQRVHALQHGHRVPERLQVALQRTGVRRGQEPAAQLVGHRGRQALVADRVGQLEDRGRPQPAVQVVVQQDLGRVTDGVEVQRHGHPSQARTPRSATSRGSSLLRSADQGAAKRVIKTSRYPSDHRPFRLRGSSPPT